MHYEATRITREYRGGHIDPPIIHDCFRGDLKDGESTEELSPDGMWQVVFTAKGAQEVVRTYWVGIQMTEPPMIHPDGKTCFEGSLDVHASSTKETVKLYYSLDDSALWNEGANVTITENTKICFIAIDSDGISSIVACAAFKKCCTWEKAVTANAIEHFLAKRIDANEFATYCRQFGSCLARFTLYLVDGKWVLEPCKGREATQPPVLTWSHDSRTYTEPLPIVLSARDKIDPSAKIYFTTDGSTPTESSDYFTGSGQIVLDEGGIRTLKCFARNSSGKRSSIETRAYEMNIKVRQPAIKADPPPGEYSKALIVTIEATDNKDKHVTVYYSDDGSIPDESSPSFEDSKQFEMSKDRNAIACYAKDSAGNKNYKTFYYSIDDHGYPDTGIGPSRGGTYAGSVEITLTPGEDIEWTKYTTDGSIPDDKNGIPYAGPFTLTETTSLIWRSKDRKGKFEPKQNAVFTITKEFEKTVFVNDKDKDGYIKGNPDGSGRSVGAFSNLAIGVSPDGKINRAILHFDTSSLPDNATITRAFLQVKYFSGMHDPWAENKLVADVKRGYFGTSNALQTDDWDSKPTAEAVCTIDKFTSGTMQSSDFTKEGLQAINMTGITQLRLRFDPNPSKKLHYIYIAQGDDAKLFIEYTV